MTSNNFNEALKNLENQHKLSNEAIIKVVEDQNKTIAEQKTRIDELEKQLKQAKRAMLSNTKRALIKYQTDQIKKLQEELEVNMAEFMEYGGEFYISVCQCPLRPFIVFIFIY